MAAPGIDEAIDPAAEGQKAAVEAFIRSARAFVALLGGHIQKEDHCLFPMAEQVLTDHDRRTLEQRFDRVNERDIGRETLERCYRTADTLAERFGVPRARLGCEATPKVTGGTGP